LASRLEFKERRDCRGQAAHTYRGAGWTPHYKAVSFLVISTASANSIIETAMRAFLALACTALLLAAAVPASAHDCRSGRCLFPRHFPARHMYYGGYTGFYWPSCHAPRGWGWARRQKLRHDCAALLVIVDELGGVTLVRGRR
jgi:hypothetical protein